MQEQKSVEVSGKSVDEAVFKGLTELGATLDEVRIEIIKEESKGVLGFGARQALVRLTMRSDEEIRAMFDDEPAKPEARTEARTETRNDSRPREHERERRERGGRDHTVRERDGREHGGRDRDARPRDDSHERPRRDDAHTHSERPRRRDDHERRAYDERPRETFVDDDPLYDVPSDNEAAVFLSGLLERMGVSSKLAVREEDEAVRIKIQSDSMGILIGHRGETLDSMQYLCSLVLNKGHKDYKRLTLDTENYRVKREETLTRLAERLAEQVMRTGETLALEPMNPYERRVMHSTLQNHSGVYTYSEGEEPGRKVIIARK